MAPIFPSGHKVEITQEFQLEMGQKFKDIGKDCIMLNPGGFLYPRKIMAILEDLYHFESFPDDVFIMSYPKTGSTWLQEIVWAMFHNAYLDNENAVWGTFKKSPFLEANAFNDTNYSFYEVFGKNQEDADETSYLGLFRGVKRPRVFKSHLHFSFLSPVTATGSKFIYVIRHPVDVCMSYHHYCTKSKSVSYTGDLATFVDDFLKGKTPTGSYLDHLRQWWERQDWKNVFTIYYEDMMINIRTEMKDLNAFLKTKLTGDQIDDVTHFTSFEQVQARRREILNSGKSDEIELCRHGETRISKGQITLELINRIHTYYRKNLGDVELPYDLDPVTEEDLF